MSKKRTTRLMIFKNLLFNGEYKYLANLILNRTYSTRYSFVLRRDLNKEFIIPNAKIEIDIRLQEEKDLEYFSEFDYELLLNENIPNCYVAITKEGLPCHRQWLIPFGHDKKIEKVFGKSCPFPKADEALFEGAFTLPDYRGKQIMPAAMSRIAEKGKELNVRWIITCVKTDNIPSLKGCWRGGFEPYLLQKIKYRIFRYSVTYGKIPTKQLKKSIFAI